MISFCFSPGSTKKVVASSWNKIVHHAALLTEEVKSMKEDPPEGVAEVTWELFTGGNER